MKYNDGNSNKRCIISLKAAVRPYLLLRGPSQKKFL